LRAEILPALLFILSNNIDSLSSIRNLTLVLILEALIKANAQQTQGNYEVYSGSSGGLISLQAKKVR